MGNKICTGCLKSKDLVDFSRKASECKNCCAIRAVIYQRTKKGLIINIYNRQRSNSKQRGHRSPEYTRQEFEEWLFSQELFHTLYNEWKMSDYKTRLVPSVDRLNDYVHYCFGNIQLMTWGENKDKGYLDRVSGKNNKANKTVLQYDMSMNFIAEYHSTNEASRVTNIGRGNIGNVCNGKRKSAGKFIWRFKV